MTDRVSASITIGGTIDAATYHDLALTIAGEDISTGWDGPKLEPDQMREGEPLRLFAHEVAWERLKELEAYCIKQGVAFARWSDAIPANGVASASSIPVTARPTATPWMRRCRDDRSPDRRVARQFARDPHPL